MLSTILTWFKEVCPFCKQKLVSQEHKLYTEKCCPSGHYKVETHPLLESQIEYVYH